MDRIQIGMIALAVLILVFWFSTLPESPERPGSARSRNPRNDRRPRPGWNSPCRRRKRLLGGWASRPGLGN
jgi:hypothetical protein